MKVKGPKKTRVVVRNSTVIQRARRDSRTGLTGAKALGVTGPLRRQSADRGFVRGLTAGVVIVGAVLLSRNFV